MRKFTLTLAIAALAVFSAGATTLGSQAFSDIGSPTVSPGSSINTATTFNIGEYFSTASDTGFLAGMPHVDLGVVSFDINNPTSFNLSNSVFGTFNSTSITEPSNLAGSVTIYILGLYSSGSYCVSCGSPAVPIVNDLASFTLTFNQNPVNTGAISDSGTFSDPPAPPPSGTPEPATMGLFGSAFVGLGLIGRRRFSKR